MKQIPQMTSESGFTLLEMLVATVILSVGLLGMAALQGTALQGNNLGGTNTEAGTVAMERIEQFKGAAYTDVSPEGVSAPEAVAGGSGTQYTRTVTIAYDTPIVNAKTVTVSVSWRSPALHTLNFQTIIAQ